MNRDEAVREAAKHTGYYAKLARDAVAAGAVSAADSDDMIQEMYLASVKALEAETDVRSPFDYLRLPCWGVCRSFSQKDIASPLSPLMEAPVSATPSDKPPLQVSRKMELWAAGFTPKEIAAMLHQGAGKTRRQISAELAALRGPRRHKAKTRRAA